MGFPVDEARVQRAERELGAGFPDDFRRSVMRDNGGAAVEWDGREWLVLPIRDDSDRTRLKRTWCDVVVETKRLRTSGLPEPFVVFADSGDGDHLLFRVAGDRMEEQIYVWDHEFRTASATSVTFGELPQV